MTIEDTEIYSSQEMCTVFAKFCIVILKLFMASISASQLNGRLAEITKIT